MSSPLQLFANAGDGVFAVDQEQRILFWNDLAAANIRAFVSRSSWEILLGASLWKK